MTPDLLELLVPVGSLLGMAGGFLGWAVGQARAVGRWEERIDQLQRVSAAVESRIEELDRSRVDQGRRIGTLEDRAKVLEADNNRRPPPLLPRPGGG